MKKIICFSIIGMIWLMLSNISTLFSQDAKKPIVVMSPLNMRVLYIGLDNPVDIAVSGVPAKDVQVTMLDGTIKEVVKGKYLVRVPDTRLKVRQARIVATYPCGRKTCSDTQYFSIRYVPGPESKFAGQSGGYIRCNHVISAGDSIYIDLPNFTYEGIYYTVTKFQMVVHTKDTLRSAYFEKATGSHLTEPMKDMLKKIGKDTKIIIFDIYAIAPGIGEKKMPDMIFTVADDCN